MSCTAHLSLLFDWLSEERTAGVRVLVRPRFHLDEQGITTLAPFSESVELSALGLKLTLVCVVVCICCAVTVLQESHQHHLGDQLLHHHRCVMSLPTQTLSGCICVAGMPRYLSARISNCRNVMLLTSTVLVDRCHCLLPILWNR